MTTDKRTFEEREEAAFRTWAEYTLKTVKLNQRGVDHLVKETGWSRTEILLLELIVTVDRRKSPLTKDLVERYIRAMEKFIDEQEEGDEWKE